MFDSLNDVRRGVRNVLRSLTRRPHVTREEIDEEIQFHLREREEHLIERGLPPEHAAREAQRRFGEAAESPRDLYRSARRRDRRLALRERAGDLLSDLRYVGRSLSLRPVFSLGVILTLALGLGVNSAVFRVADHILFRPPPGVAAPDELRRVQVYSAPGSPRAGLQQQFSWPAVEALQSSGAFGGLGTYSSPDVQLDGAGREALVTHVDAGYFTTLGVRAHAGRLFAEAESRPGAGIRVAVVSHAFWLDRLGARAPNEGLTVSIDDEEFFVVGVVSPEFHGVDADPVDVWLPVGAAQFGRMTQNGVVIPWYGTSMATPLRVIARMPPNVSEESVSARAGAALAAITPGGSDEDTASLRLAGIAGDGSSRTVSQRALLFRLEAVAIFVLLIACANAANLLLARNIRRRRELAVRMAVGAGRSRITALLVAESVSLALTGGAAAVVAGYWTAVVLQRLLLPDARWSITPMDERTLTFTAILTLATGLAAVLAPMRQLRRLDLASALKGSGTARAATPARLQHVLVGAQAALAATLLIFTGLVLRSLYEVGTARLGFDPEGLVMISDQRFPPRASGGLDVVIARAEQHPQVQAAALVSMPPFGSRAQSDFTIPGRPPAPPTDQPGPYVMSVAPDFFAAMGTRVVSGRGFTSEDVLGSEPVAVVNEAMARAYWPGESPLASCIMLTGRPCARVVGIVEDFHTTRGDAQAPMRFYLVLEQQGATPRSLMVRTSGEMVADVAADLVAALPPDARIRTEVVRERLDRALRPWRVAALLFSLFSVLAVVLACLGVYSTMSYLTLERVREMGIRITLGATRGAIAGLVLRSALRSAGAGVVCGAVVAALGSRLLASLLYGVSQVDPAVYVAAGMLLTGIAAAAALIPALRVARTQPTVTLRAE